MTLRLLIYCDDHGTGGAALATHRLALGLAERDYEVLYAQAPAASPRFAEREARGIRSVTVPYDMLLQFDIAMDDTRTPARLLLEHKPDVVIFSDVLAESTIGAKQAAAVLKIPYLTVKHLIRANSLYSQVPAIRDRVRRSIAAASEVITVSRDNREILAACFPAEAGRLTVIHNSIPDRFFEPRSAARRQAFRRRFAIPEPAVAVLTVAALVKRKGFQYQARLIRGLKAAGVLERFVFVWAGEGEAAFFDPLWQELEAAGCTGQIRRIGFQQDIPECLDGSDLVLLPSEEEGMPLVVLEAMARGVPVVASAVGGTPEALSEGGGELIADPTPDPQRMIADMHRILTGWGSDPAERDRIGAAGRRRAMAAFSSPVMIGRYEAAIRRAVVAPGDYVSPGLRMVHADWAFPCVFGSADPTGGHDRYVDIRYSRMPMLNRDEVLLIYNTALGFRDRRALEIGGWLGWASYHLLAGGVGLDVVEPLLGHPPIRESVSSWIAGRTSRKVRLFVGRSPEMVMAIPFEDGQPWSLFLIDAERAAPAPAADAAACEARAARDALILMAGADQPGVAAALRGLKGRGWSIRLYRTANRLAAAWRGTARPVDHHPDPRIPALPAALADLADLADPAAAAGLFGGPVQPVQPAGKGGTANP